MSETNPLPYPTIGTLKQHITVKNTLKALTLLFLLVAIVLTIVSLIIELRQVHKISKEDKEYNIRELEVEIYSSHFLYFAYYILGVHIVLKEKYPLLVCWVVVDFVLDIISAFDIDSYWEIMFDFTLTVLAFATAVCIRIESNVSWNPF